MTGQGDRAVQRSQWQWETLIPLILLGCSFSEFGSPVAHEDVFFYEGSAVISKTEMLSWDACVRDSENAPSISSADSLIYADDLELRSTARFDRICTIAVGK